MCSREINWPLIVNNIHQASNGHELLMRATQNCLARLIPRLISFAWLPISSLLMFVLFCLFCIVFFIRRTPLPPLRLQPPPLLRNIELRALSGEEWRALTRSGRSISGSRVQQTLNVDEMRRKAEQ